MFVNALQENVLVLVFADKIQSLCGKIANDIGYIASPVRNEALLFRNANQTVDDTLSEWKQKALLINVQWISSSDSNTFVPFIFGYLFGNMLHL